MAWSDLAARVHRTAAAPFTQAIQYESRSLGLGTIDITGVFDEAGERAVFSQAEVITTQPKLMVNVSDMPDGSPAFGDLVTVISTGALYTVESWEYDAPRAGVTIWLIDDSSEAAVHLPYNPS